MKMLILFLFMLSCSSCYAKTPETTGIMNPDKLISTCLMSSSESAEPMQIGIMLPSAPYSIVIKAGDGWIKIHVDGKVELENVTLDKAAQEFWEKVAAAFPQFKENILREAAEQATRKEGGFFITVPGKGL